ncbi:MAG: tandem-95 repeat protein, partial [Acidimicrobiia bacterium]|nr:tandem-95 repeat protein [Acidimicrobiia bacterium]
MADEKFQGVSEDSKWSGKPVLAFVVRAAILIVPILASILFSIWLSRRLPPATSIWGLLGWWGIIIAASTIVLFSVDKLARKFLPLAALLSMTMVFPDKSPSRFKTALRSGSSVKQLKATLAEAEALGKDDDITHAAELVLQLTTALNTHDPRTRGHAERVRAYTDMLAEELEFSEMDRAKLRWASLLHDIGKLKVDTDILNKPSKLDDDEWLQIKKHPLYGKEICEPLWEWLGEWNGAILDHHERYDGNGYPNGKKAEEISMAGRVVCVADAYDVMTTVRSYKKPLPNAVAREELARHAGSQFDPHVVRAFLGLAMGRLRWVAGPLSWLGQLPFLNFAGAIQSVGTSVGVAGVAAVGAVGAISTGAVDIPGEDPLPLPEPPPVLAQFESDAPVYVPVTPTADVTVPADDAFDVAGGEPTELAVLANDAIASGGVISIARLPDFGTVIINIDGTVTYVPEEGYSGEDSFEYAIADDSGVSAAATVALSVIAANEPPMAEDDAVTTDEDTALIVDVLANDIDEAEFDVAALTIITDPVNGEVEIDAETGTILYTPEPDFAGVDAFSYQLVDPEGLTDDAVVTITVEPVNDVPVVEDASVSMAEDGSVTIDAVALASDVDDGIDPSSVSISIPPAFGTAAASPSGIITYSPNANANGVDGFSFSVCDLGGACTTATAFVAVTAVNDPPVVPGPGPITVTEDDTFTFDPLAGATDIDGDALSMTSFDAVSGSGGSIVEGSLIYTPPLNYTGADSFTYQVSDGAAT